MDTNNNKGDNKIWKCERTNFSFVKFNLKSHLDDQPRTLLCVGDDAPSFLNFLRRDGYSNNQSYVLKAKKGNRKLTLGLEKLFDQDIKLFDPRTIPEPWAYILVLRDQSSLNNLYRTVIPFIFKASLPIECQIIVVHMNSVRDTAVTLEQVKTAAEFVGATHILTILREDLLWGGDSSKKINEISWHLATQMLGKVSYTDKDVLRKFNSLALVRSNDNLNQDLSSMLDPNFVDPLGNNLLHYAVTNNNQEVFYYLANNYQQLINSSNNDGLTPIHEWVTRGLEKIDWDRLWKLPIEFSKKNNDELTCLMMIQELSCAHIAFEALIKNEEAWTRARKHHKRKVILTNAVHAMLKDWKDNDMEPGSKLPARVKFFVDKGASIRHHNGTSLLHTAITCNRLQATIELLNIQSKLQVEDFVECWKKSDPVMIRFLVKRPEIDQLSQENINQLTKQSIMRGLNDVLRILLRKGGSIDGATTERLATANIIAQMRHNIILPLKFQCVDVIYESKMEQRKSSEGEEINWDNELKNCPEEIKDLFPRKEFWRWALFLEDEKKRDQILKLYQTINNQITNDEKTFEVQYGAVTFCYCFSEKEKRLWIGSLNDNSPETCCRMYYSIYNENAEFDGVDSLWMDKIEEDHKEVLDQLVLSCGWDLEDAYLFLHILNTTYICNGDEWYLQYYLFDKVAYEFRIPPKWYIDFVKRTYGLNHPERMLNHYIKYYA